MKKNLAAFFVFFLCLSVVFAQKSGRAVENASLVQGYEAYRNEDWISAIFHLKKVVSSASTVSEENYLMLVKSEIFAGEYDQAQKDCERFLEKYAFSSYAPYIKYQNGRLLHLLGKNENAIKFLSDFCHEYDSSEYYPSALFWIAEAFYDEYNFDSAKGIYTRIVSDFTGSEKAAASSYKLALIERRAREEKLLYLLKVTGEENLSTREEYERQLKIYEAEDKIGLKKQLVEAQGRILELEAMIASDEQSRAAAADRNKEDIENLKKKALKLQQIIDEKKSSGF